MSQRRPASFAAALVLGLVTGIASVPAGADDTDIYLSAGAGSDDITAPNVLLVLDTSDSMNQEVTGTGLSRLENMRVALVDLLNSFDNVKVGLMRMGGYRNPNNPDNDGDATTSYLGTGGPIIFPVANLDDRNSDIHGEPDSENFTVEVQVAHGDDDAEELAIGTVDVNDSILGLGAKVTEEVRVLVQNDLDQSEQHAAGTPPFWGGNDFDLTVADFTGMLFDGVQVPQDALIVSAEISFVAKTSYAGTPAEADIFGITDFSIDTFSRTASSELEGLSLTSATVGWSIDEWTAGEWRTDDTTTPDLKDIVQEMVELGGWNPGGLGDTMGFFVDGREAENGQLNLSTRNREALGVPFGTPDGTGHKAAPELHIAYKVKTEPEQVALRFRNVRIPQGATITSAAIDFIAADSANNLPPHTFAIEIENNISPVSYTTATNDISSRSWTGSQAWSPAAVAFTETGLEEDTDFVTVTTSDLSSLIQPLVSDSSWCGGLNSLSFRITGTGRMGVKSYEEDPTRAAVLRVSYDTTPIPVGGGCIATTYTFQPSAGRHDGEEKANTAIQRGWSSMNLGRNLKLTEDRTAAVIFPNVTLDPDQDILSASILFTGSADLSDPVTISIQGDVSGNADDIGTADGNITDTTNRPRTSAGAAVSWTPGAVMTEQVFATPDLSTLIEEMTDSGTGWAFENQLGFYFTRESGSSLRRAYTFNGSAAKSPVLRLTATETKGNSGFKTVRQRLIELVNQQIYTLNRTPTVETLYEAALYWRGEPMDFAVRRGADYDSDGSMVNGMRYARVSHPATYSGGTLSRPSGCGDDPFEIVGDMNALVCKEEEITGTPVYNSPIGSDDECENNFMIFLSDGAPTQNDAADRVKNLLGISDCSANPRGANGACANDLLEDLATNDQIGNSSDGEQTVTTYTIGFNLDQGVQATTVEFMEDLAEKGGGEFFSADTAAQLTNVLTSIFTDILSRTSSFASPSLSVNAFNKLFSRDEVYFALFRPDLTQRWNGNIKKLKICSDSSSCTLGELLDANDVPAIGSDSRILDSAQTVWSSVEDGSEIEVGGAGDKMPSVAARTIYTDLGLSAHPASPVNLGAVSNDQELNDTNDETNTLYRDEICQVEDCDAMMQWFLGAHGLNEADDTRTGASTLRWAINDPLHSSPVIVTFGGTESTPIDKVFVGTNDGALRMFNGSNDASVGGLEEWAFYPGEFLGIQEPLMNNTDSGGHIYGVDLTPRVLTNDVDNDGIIEPADGDFVWLFVGLRRGGSSYYALDVTPAAPLTSNSVTPGSPSIVPKFMWRITAGDNDSFGNFTRLGQTWSRPVVGQASVDDGSGGVTSKRVLIFGGGYDPALDSGYGLTATGGSANLGNAIYVVDAETGELIRWFSSDAGADIVVNDGSNTKMDYSIPTEISALDTNGDQLIDRLYFGDTAGNVWRIDLGANLGASPTTGDQTIVGKLASLATEGVAADERVILERPDVIQVQDAEFAAAGKERYDLVVVVTGNRPDPLETDVEDHVFAIRDLAYQGLTDTAAPAHLADGGYPKASNVPLTHSDLENITDNLIQDATGTTQADAIDDLKSSRGWYLELETAAGEKALAAPITLAGKLFLTTFLPVSNPNSCEANEGQGQLYALDVLTGGAVLNFDDDADEELTKDDRTHQLGAGIPSSAVPIFQEEGITLLVGSSGGAESVDPDISLPRERTYWLQQ